MAEELDSNGAPEAAGKPSGEKPAASKAKVDAKVELDLDDAPFLDEDEPEPEPEPEKKPAAAPEKAKPADAGPPTLKERLLANKKKLIMAGGGGVLLLVLAVCVNVFLFSGEKTPPPSPAPEPEKVLAAPKPLPEAPVPRHILQLEPFWVEIKDTEGAIRFLTLKFSVPTENPVLFAEMNGKKLILRDALFYYLRNQPIISLTDEAKAQAFKRDILTVMNEHLGSGKISEILIQDYLVQ
ncbi:Flagellar basal body-associated protein FliL [uncultured delta proteobacterium]|uniref:Flagellar protein FliL n=1 Tax=uncultured delta proteobacterium TaxID=34034 RepID=A0A212IU37_9DELT|nr:Flagellar basal body-associated protein FliL [uncultured delta proteobacterium]